ncbi:DUF1826 domain-containing protein [Falsiruegeria mediterranea]
MPSQPVWSAPIAEPARNTGSWGTRTSRITFSPHQLAPILLRGTLWPDQSKSRLVHRSPPIEGTGEARLLLVLDPVDEPENEPDHQYLH